ncbi:MAG TPA: 2-oxo-4-hydroxy-4-carboxy-5-ureidoimidazoline decarboxylase [bacterium]|nr:2-oxo-4-hydroxy-4-carboxy-5-ureidoimidazoline decarboxylase [bacterium]
MPAAQAEDQLHGCLPNHRWAARLVAGRPYRDPDDLLVAADINAGDLTDQEWLEAIAAHPRIGEGGGHSPDSSAREQSRVLQASVETLDALAAENRHYEKRFGHVFLIAASGRSGDEILGELRRRMNNNPATELEEAKRELRKIVQIRLGKLLSG